jgi:hypothetical protein
VGVRRCTTTANSFASGVVYLTKSHPGCSGSQFGCRDHLASATGTSPIAGQKAVSFDVAAWADLWFYSNPVYIQVGGSTVVAGVQ